MLPKSVEVIAMLAESGAEPRLAMRGTSMLPLLREPMVLQVSRFSGNPKMGDVVVFIQNDRFVAHRFIARRRDGAIVLAGDALPGEFDIVLPDQIIGSVTAVWSGSERDARRIDGFFHRSRGFITAFRRATNLRAGATLRKVKLALCCAIPQLRPRAYHALFKAMAAILQSDPDALRAALVEVDPEVLLHRAVRHRCAPLLRVGVEALGVLDAIPASVLQGLDRERWSTAMRTRVLRQQLDRVIEICDQIGVIPILLKGAARLYTCEANSELHDSDDIDILVPFRQMASTVSAFRAVGYSQDAKDIERYEQLHHAAPLFSPNGVGLEVHHVLAPPGEICVLTDYESVTAHTELQVAANGCVRILDPFASALHSTIHAREPTTLRNLVILAAQLRQLPDEERDALYAIADREDIQRHRMHAALYAASLLAGLPARPTAAGRQLFGWRMRRYDLPFALASRSDAIEWFIATPRSDKARALRALQRSETDSERSIPQPLRSVRYAYKLSLKVTLVAMAAIFAALLPNDSKALVTAGE